jgi:HECT-domain (ubiquitin-transferase)
MFLPEVSFNHECHENHGYLDFILLFKRSFLLLLGSHTCSFALDLPAYTTTEIMYERLNYAITYCSSIDGDG